MTVYYNENDPFAAAWLRELIKHGHIADGDVDTRSISDVAPVDLKDYTQCHFFAGVGVWSLALRSAGWPDDRPVWTGSCPCQPFSSAGKRKGTSDERHLWPHWFWLIQECRPVEVFGEQVASKDGRAWFDTVSSDMEALDYTVGAADMCAAGFGAPHIRQRLWFYAQGLGDAGFKPGKWDTRGVFGAETKKHISRGEDGHEPVRSTNASGLQPIGLGDADDTGLSARGERPETSRQGYPAEPARCSIGLAESEHKQRERFLLGPREGVGAQSGRSAVEPTRLCEDHPTHPTNGFWRDVDWLGCRDGKFRPVEPGTFPLVDGPAARVGRLRGYGNAIVAPVAQAFIEATQGW